jgi:cytochrome c553
LQSKNCPETDAISSKEVFCSKKGGISLAITDSLFFGSITARTFTQLDVNGQPQSESGDASAQLVVRIRRLVGSFKFRLLLAVAQLMVFCQPAFSDSSASVEFFEKKVRPILVGNCYSCHSASTKPSGNLRVDDRNGMIRGGDSGPAVVPGHPEKSLMLRAVSYADDDLKMPPKKQLSAEQVANLTKWIHDGAAWPQLQVAAASGKSDAKYEKLRNEHWAWQPLRDAKVRGARRSPRRDDPIDSFLLAKLEENGLQPVSEADKLTLIRRVTFDLTGLPPTPEEIDAFATNNGADAFEKLVDRLLGSPAFGERWGRHWLDVARYGESTGSTRNIPYPHAWRYRDYVINAFNDDKPFNQFVLEQIAGDLLPAQSQRERDEHLVATGLLALGVKDVNQRFKVRFTMDNIDEQIDTVTRSLLALTASCARCHDHKFDPIPTADYYALAGIFHSSDLCAGVRSKMGGGGLAYYDTQMLLPLGGKSKHDSEAAREIAAATKRLAQAQAELETLRGKSEVDNPSRDGRSKREIIRGKINQIRSELLGLSDPAANGGQVALGVRDAKEVGDTEIRIRGEAEKLGPVVPRGFLTVLRFPDQPTVNPKQSGRLELARWLISDRNPLTPRVQVNRVWQQLFGEGLVRSVDNFGVTGDVPSHPELLDHLAANFVRDGWSIKKLVRRLVLSRAYRLGSAAPAAQFAVDPANRFVWRHNPRRLEAEEIRDATLAAAGTLSLSRPQASPAKDLKVVELTDNGQVAKRLAAAGRASLHRSVYLPLLRGLTPTSLRVFDFAEQGMVTGHRDTTTVATQSLYLLNDPFVRSQSLALAQRLLRRIDLDDAGRVRWAYQLTVGRAATAQEIERAKGYLSEYEFALRAMPSTTYAAANRPPVVALARANVAVTTRRTAGAGKARRRNAAPKLASKQQAVEAAGNNERTGSAIESADPKTATWASFCQALLGTAEFRFIK